MVGNVISAIVGVTCFKIFGESIPSENVETLLGLHGMNWIAAPFAVSLAITFQFLTSSLHPPGGAIALIATIGGAGIKRTGYWYVLVPSLLRQAEGLVDGRWLVALVWNGVNHYDAAVA